MASKGRHAVDPLAYSTTRRIAQKTLVDILSADSHVRIVDHRTGFIRAEFRSRWMGFIDDVEFIFSSKHPMIRVRSASRVGYYDFGLNRKRVEIIRRKLIDASVS